MLLNFNHYILSCALRRISLIKSRGFYNSVSVGMMAALIVWLIIVVSIYKTAYPYYSDKKKISEDGIAKDYELSSSEIMMIKKRTPEDIDAHMHDAYCRLLLRFDNDY